MHQYWCEKARKHKDASLTSFSKKNGPDITSRLFLYVSHSINLLPNDKIFYLSKLKSFADDNSNINQKLKCALGKVENIVRKGENAGYQHFLLSPQCFQKTSSLGLLKVGIMW